MSPRVWLITGTSSGFGYDLAKLLLQKDEIVIATARKLEALSDLQAKYPSSQLLTVRLNVDDAQNIKDAFAKAKEVFGRVDVVFNNAGWGAVGEVEAHPEAEARKIFDTNFWGSTNVTREAVRFFREENQPSGGLILITSSLGGIQSVPGLSYYSASKHAIEGITQGLAAELDPSWNIKFSLIEPGSFFTEATQTIVKAGAKPVIYTHPAYTNPTLPSVAFRGVIGSGMKLGSDPAKAVKRIYDLSLLTNPPFRFPLGKDAVAGVKAQLKKIEDDVVKYESWSDGLELDN